MLWKNFGITRHGKVVFYDYDEIEYITDCNFRKCPHRAMKKTKCPARSGTPWGPKTCSRRPLAPFLLGNPAVREIFMKHHADLLEASFWQRHKDRILQGHVIDVFPYDERSGFCRRTVSRIR
jgi:isocitrate dehydrogenase kinase/phosphatase